ncbi:MAG: AAA family ATPase [Planctomycetota bacterium]|nr:AAA family ATPase [Planctomycetota bacterium]
MTRDATDPQLAALITKAREGGPDEAATLSKYLRRLPATVTLLLELGRAPEDTLRMAVAFALGGREESELLALVSELVRDEAPLVRSGVANAWKRDPAWPIEEADGLILLGDEEGTVRKAAVGAAVHRTAFATRVLEMLEDDGHWEVRQTASRGLAQTEDSTAAAALLRALCYDSDMDVARACAEALETWLGREGGFAETMPRPDVAGLEVCRDRLDSLGQRRFAKLFAWAASQVERQVDPASLNRVGTHLTGEAETGRLPRAHGDTSAYDHVVDILTGEAPRAVVLLGEPGTGKTAFVHELTHRLAAHPDGAWHVVRVAPSEILAGTKWLGEWETKVDTLVKAVKRPKQVVLYVPNAHELGQVGRSSASDTNVASMLLPSIENGDVAILAESTPRAWAGGTGREPSAQRLFTSVEFQSATDDITRGIVRAVCADAGQTIDELTIDRLMELAAFYLSGTEQPGRSVGLLRRVLEGHPPGSELDESEILAHISQSTGVPISILDDRVPLNLPKVRQFFEDRVMGQPEALDAVVDLVTLIKAGLTDPAKPYGVLLFVGPTGVGKTELARALAELLFGDASRLKRFDMSEYATYAAFERLIGTGDQPGLLTASVRDDPFAVILLDEIEKAHVNVFDLCLQIFDAGRLTDAHGRTSDFRRAIFILTSNVGSKIQTEAAVGFGGKVPPPPDPEQTQRALRQVFRPEFIGRLDAVVHFRQLSVETAQRIARREVVKVLERSGIARRRLSVDVDPSVLAFLLQRGYSPALGARPLKRTVERYVLLPVARAIAHGSVPPESILRVVAQGNGIHVQIEKPDAEVDVDAPPTDDELTPELSALRERIDAMRDQLPQILEPAESLRAHRRELLERAKAPDFWDDRPRAARDMDEVHRSEGLLTAIDTLERRVRDSHGHVFRARTATRGLIERLDELEREQRRLVHLLGCTDPHLMADAFVTITRVKLTGDDIDAVERLARMYRAFAKRNRLEAEVLSDVRGGEPPEDSITLLVSGVGAMSVLLEEAGLHQFLRPSKDPSPARRNANQELVRVAVLAADADETALATRDVRIESRKLQRVGGRLLKKPDLELSLLHVPTLRSVNVWTTGPKQEAVERLLPLLAARVGATVPAPDDATGPVIRRYRLGSAPSVRDLRTGRLTTRLERVLAGEVDRIRS